MNDIKFSKVLTAKGRNGLLKQTGLAITPNAEKDTLSLSPLTSKGFTDSCWIEIPKENIPELLPIFGTDDLIAELKKRNADPATFTDKQELIASLLETIYARCEEFIDGERKSPGGVEGFEDIQANVSQIKCLLGLLR